MLVRWLVFIHVLAVITFFLAHSTSAAMTFQLRKEKSIERIQAMLDLSLTTFTLLFVSYLVMGITGLVMVFLIKIWNQVWVWVSVALMVYVFIHMALRNDKTYKILRKLVGLPYRLGNKDFPTEPPASDEEILAHIRKISVHELVTVGFVIPAFVLWLMMFKPF